MKLEQTFPLIQRLHWELAEKDKTDGEYYAERKQDVNKNIDFFKKIRNDEKQPLVNRALAAYIITNENNVMALHADQMIEHNYLLQLTILTEMSINAILEELSLLKGNNKAQLNSNESDKILNLEKQLTRLKKTTEDWKPIISDLKEGQRRTKKYLNENR